MLNTLTGNKTEAFDFFLNFHFAIYPLFYIAINLLYFTRKVTLPVNREQDQNVKAVCGSGPLRPV